MYQEAFARLLQTEVSLDTVRAAERDLSCSQAIQAVLEQSGFIDILRPEAEGGAGLTLRDFAPLVMECGRVLCPVPFAEMAVGAKMDVSPEMLPDHVKATVIAGYMAGAMDAIFELTVAHCTTRQQFGKNLSQFQAIQQQLAQMAEEVAASRLAVAIGFGGIDFDPNRAAVAKIRCSEAATYVAATAHQLHGAIGATAEYDLQLFTRALWRWQRDSGTASYWAEHLGQSQAGQPILPFIQSHLESGASA